MVRSHLLHVLRICIRHGNYFLYLLKFNVIAQKLSYLIGRYHLEECVVILDIQRLLTFDFVSYIFLDLLCSNFFKLNMLRCDKCKNK